jgi:hypothetical protein
MYFFCKYVYSSWWLLYHGASAVGLTTPPSSMSSSYSSSLALGDEYPDSLDQEVERDHHEDSSYSSFHTPHTPLSRFISSSEEKEREADLALLKSSAITSR